MASADKRYAMGEYYAAADLYRDAYRNLSAQKEKEEKAVAAFKQAECYRHISSVKAAAAYRNAIRFGYPDSTTYLRYAQALQGQGNYKEAIRQYRIYLERNHPYRELALAGLKGCEQIENWKNQDSRYQIRQSKALNGRRSSTYSPMFIGSDTTRVMFTSNRVQQTKENKKKVRNSRVTGAPTFNLWQIEKNAKGEWEKAELAEGLYDNADEEKQENDSTSSKQTGQREMGSCCFTSDGTTMYFTYACPENGKTLGAKIYTCSRASGAWASPQELILFSDSSITAAHPALNAAGDTLYFVSDAPGGYGGKDIWFAVQTGNEWEVENAGATINTAGDEMFPYVHADGTLYFASNGHPGFGGLDLFRVDSTGVVNMGIPFNSKGDDFGITFAGNSQNGFFSTNRTNSKGTDLVFEFRLPELVVALEGKVCDENGNPIVDAWVRVVGNDGTNARQPIHKDGSYNIRLDKNARYALMASARGYLNESGQLTTENRDRNKTYTQNFVLRPTYKPVRMENVFYDFNRWNLSKDSEKSLNALIKILQDNPNITIELSAHTDMIGDSTYNVTLSQKRAQSCVDYLIKAGIASDRLTAKGYGKNQPVEVSPEMHKQYRWMPEGQTLDETFILSRNPEEQDICNKINRRTEFKVLRTTYGIW